MMQYAVNVFPAVFDQLFRFQFLRLFVLALQFLEFQSHAIIASLIKTFGG